MKDKEGPVDTLYTQTTCGGITWGTWCYWGRDGSFGEQMNGCWKAGNLHPLPLKECHIAVPYSIYGVHKATP